MNLIDEILATAPKHEPEFEARIYDLAGRLVDALLMERKSGALYASETYTGPDRIAIVTLFRDGVPIAVLGHGVTIATGFYVNATIPDPNGNLGRW